MQGSRTERRRGGEGREETFLTRVACKAEEKEEKEVERGKQIKIKKYILIYLGLLT